MLRDRVAIADEKNGRVQVFDRQGIGAMRVRRLRKDSETWGEFKTPSLRNLAGRGPYMHQGQFPDLESVIRFYSTLEGAAGRSHHQEQILAPLELTPTEAADLVSFLRALDGEALDESSMPAPSSPLLDD